MYATHVASGSEPCAESWSAASQTWRLAVRSSAAAASAAPNDLSAAARRPCRIGWEFSLHASHATSPASPGSVGGSALIGEFKSRTNRGAPQNSPTRKSPFPVSLCELIGRSPSTSSICICIHTHSSIYMEGQGARSGVTVRPIRLEIHLSS
eukprot:scaffold6786_cov112-Isochrysis_galbana.AAC.1